MFSKFFCLLAFVTLCHADDSGKFQEYKIPSVTSNFEVNVLSVIASEEPMPDVKDKTCVDYRPKGWYLNRTFQSGLPPSGVHANRHEYNFVTLPSNFSPCELEKVQLQALSYLNGFRSGNIPFNNNYQDPDVNAGLEPFKLATGNIRCEAAATLGDLNVNYLSPEPYDPFAGAHQNAFVCLGAGLGAQNTCNARGHFARSEYDRVDYTRNYDTVRFEFWRCNNAMWNEARFPERGQDNFLNMKNPLFRYVSFGFAWSEQGRLLITYNFYEHLPVGYTSCSCDGKNHGDDDGCGGKCVKHGEWYCRKAGRKTGRFTMKKCESLCVNNFRHARCCSADAGKFCGRNEKINKKYCGFIQDCITV